MGILDIQRYTDISDIIYFINHDQDIWNEMNLVQSFYSELNVFDLYPKRVVFSYQVEKLLVWLSRSEENLGRKHVQNHSADSFVCQSF